VIDALLETVGEEGTIVIPTHSKNLAKVDLSEEQAVPNLSWLFKILPYDADETPCTTGLIPESFRKRPSVLRSLHSVLSVAAAGSKAQEIVETGREGSLKAWKRVLQLDGYVLLIGVDLGVCTAMHLAEERVSFPKQIVEKITAPQWFVRKYPADEWEWDFGPYPNFAKMEEPCRKRKIVKTVKVGKTTMKLFRLRELIDLYTEYLLKNPYQFYEG